MPKLPPADAESIEPDQSLKLPIKLEIVATADPIEENIAQLEKIAGTIPKKYTKKEGFRKMIDERSKVVARCSKCGYQMCADEVWVLDNMDDKRVFCFSHAPDDAIRLKDLSKPIEPIKEVE